MSIPSDSRGTNFPEGQRPVGDFFGPFYKVTFLPLTNETGTIETALGPGGSDQQTLVPTTGPTETGLSSIFEIDSRLLPRTVADLKIESNAGSPFKFTLTLTPPYDDGIRILNNRLLTFGTVVRVQWGYASWGPNNIESDVHIFRNNLPQAEFGDDSVKIVLSGNDMSSDVAMRNQRRKQWLFSEYPSDSAIVSELISRTGMTIDVTRVPLSSSFLTGSNRPTPAPGEVGGVTQVINDWAFIRRLCRDHSLSCSARDYRFHVYSLYDFSANPDGCKYRLLYRTAPTSDFDIPVTSVKGNLNPWLFLPPEGRGLVKFRANTDTGAAEVQLVDGTNVSGTPLAETAPAGTTGPSASGIPVTLASTGGDRGESIVDENGVKFTPRPAPTPPDIGAMASIPEDSHNAEEKIDAIVREAVCFSHPKVGITAVGVVDMWPGVLCRLEGTSRLFDGPYSVLKATHILGSNGYDMELELMRHSVVTEQGDVSLGGPPTNPPVSGATTETPTEGGTAADSPGGGITGANSNLQTPGQ